MPTTSARLSVLMPVYNEARTLNSIIPRVLEAPVDLEIELVCVDDGSVDNSWAILQEWAERDSRVRPVRHNVNRGKGAAIRTAIDHMSGDIAVVQDSDLEYDPADFPKLLRPILDDRADAVFGSRFASSPERRVLLYWHSLGNRLLTWVTNVLNDLNLTDMETCYKAVSADVLRDLRLRSERFGIEPEITTRLAQWGARIYEVPISYHGRGYDEGKNIGWRDGVEALWLLLRFRFLDSRFSQRQVAEPLKSAKAPAAVSRWTLQQFDGHVGSTVLEVGAGVGNITRLLLSKERVVVLDKDPFYVRILDRRWGHLSNIEVVNQDPSVPGFGKKHSDQFDTVICVNTLEWEPAAEAVVSELGNTLKSGGRLLVIAHAASSGGGVRRPLRAGRLDRSELRKILASSGLEVIEMADFNRLAAIGWRFAGSDGDERRLWQLRLFRLLLPVAKLVEKAKPLPALSLVAVARKP